MDSALAFAVLSGVIFKISITSINLSVNQLMNRPRNQRNDQAARQLANQ